MTRIERPTMIIALALALFLWAYVRIIQDTPDSTRIFRGIPVTLNDSGVRGFAYRLSSKSQTVDITVKGPADRLNSLTRDDLVVGVDLAGITSAEKVVRPRVQLPRGLTAARVQDVTVNAYPLKQRSFPVKISFIVQPPPGTTVGGYDVQPSEVVVQGNAEALDQVKYVIVRLDPTQPLTSEREVIPSAVNANGNQVADAQILSSSVTVQMASLTGEQLTRRVAVRQPELRNQPRGYQVRIVRIRPDVVTLNGTRTQLDRLGGFITTEAIDVREIKRDTSVTARLHVPSGLSVIEGPTVRVDLEAQAMR